MIPRHKSYDNCFLDPTVKRSLKYIFIYILFIIKDNILLPIYFFIFCASWHAKPNGQTWRSSCCKLCKGKVLLRCVSSCAWSARPIARTFPRILAMSTSKVSRPCGSVCAPSGGSSSCRLCHSWGTSTCGCASPHPPPPPSARARTPHLGCWRPQY